MRWLVWPASAHVILAERYDSILFDLDGVMYRGDRAVDHAGEVIQRLRQQPRPRLAFVTNNSSRTAAEVAGTLTALGIETRAEEVVTSAEATAALVDSKGGGSAFVIGETGIRRALEHRGVRILDGTPASVDWVVVGFDRAADYGKLRTASLLVQRGAKLVATNADGSYPAPDGAWPGAGALLAVVTTTTGAVPEVVGKPHAPLFDEARKRAGGGATLFVGDRLETDVAGASSLGLDTLLVFTGIARPMDVVRSDVLPVYLGRDLRAILEDGPVVRPAADRDADGIEDVLRSSDLEARGVEERIHATVVAATEDGKIVGTAALEVEGELAHLRSLAVAGRHRRGFLGTLLTAHEVRNARRSAARELYLATETAEVFFARLGFERVGVLDALPGIFRERMKTSCASTAVTMRLGL